MTTLLCFEQIEGVDEIKQIEIGADGEGMNGDGDADADAQEDVMKILTEPMLTVGISVHQPPRKRRQGGRTDLHPTGDRNIRTRAHISTRNAELMGLWGMSR